jgi:hypothetical protein
MRMVMGAGAGFFKVWEAGQRMKVRNPGMPNAPVPEAAAHRCAQGLPCG